MLRKLFLAALLVAPPSAALAWIAQDPPPVRAERAPRAARGEAPFGSTAPRPRSGRTVAAPPRKEEPVAVPAPATPAPIATFEGAGITRPVEDEHAVRGRLLDASGRPMKGSVSATGEAGTFNATA